MVNMSLETKAIEYYSDGQDHYDFSKVKLFSHVFHFIALSNKFIDK